MSPSFAHLLENELPITGYVDRFSRRPGEVIRLHVSERAERGFRIRLVRVVSVDPNPQGPGMVFEDLSRRLDVRSPGKRYPITLGSYAVAPAPILTQTEAHTWTALIWPGLLPVADAAILSHEAEERRLTLSITGRRLQATVSTVNGEHTISLPANLEPKRWYRVWATSSPSMDGLELGVWETGRLMPVRLEEKTPPLTLPLSGAVHIAARAAARSAASFDGKIEDPAILRGGWPEGQPPLMALRDAGADLLAGWDFSVDQSSQTIVDVGPHGLHGRLVNVPTRAVRGARWTGDEHRWILKPREYGAIHFHSDDLGDSGWPAALEFQIPVELRSGSYAFHLTSEGGEDWVPFYVLPPRDGPRAQIAFLAPTFTYLAYANHRRGNYDAAFRERVAEWGAYPYDPVDHPIYGVSTYNLHPDGSGVVHSSRLRPILSMRPAFITINDAHGSGLRHYPADAHLLAWLESKGFVFDVVTDDDLDEEGAELLAPYALVLTGSHPEYHTTRSLEALSGYLHGGGSLAYLGGNGFYWRIARSKDLPEVLELRRAEGGTRAWAAEPGEYFHAADGSYGGLWRRNGRPPQALVGVGFSAQATFRGGPFHRTAESFRPQLSWMFAGIEGDVLGDYGLSGGGAAGYELDRADAALGTPSNAVVVARAGPPPGPFGVTPEDMLHYAASVTGEPLDSLVRADMTYFETGFGGAVFSAGSITFCGSLWRNGFEGPISTLLENVVRRLSQPPARAQSSPL